MKDSFVRNDLVFRYLSNNTLRKSTWCNTPHDGINSHGLMSSSFRSVGDMFRSSVVSLPAAAPSCPHAQGFPPAAALVRNLHHGHHSSVSLSSACVTASVSTLLQPQRVLSWPACLWTVWWTQELPEDVWHEGHTGAKVENAWHDLVKIFYKPVSCFLVLYALC